ncbi:universal stress protein [Paenibacillus albiflavus]|uniref:Universal stress protein n=1 Tax=Paenibacillus albiflavus TaxID=2545760 RepID=A0A4V2WN56_9BACL|nr:universal stress protein [Paenibacillus albiflavus]TCZ74242.1 universal stress protein [Paenibacillus albiflavus]
MLFHKILVAFDGSKASNQALDKAIELTKVTPNAELEIVHVLQFPNFVIGEAMINTPIYIRDDYYQSAEKVRDEAKARVADLGITANVTLLEGGAAESILEFAEDKQCDLIVIGSRGLGGIREFFLGSVSHNVVQHAKIPVLIAK